jgi:hypothetical protein
MGEILSNFWGELLPVIIVVGTVYWAIGFSRTAQRKYESYLEQHMKTTSQNMAKVVEMNEASANVSIQSLVELKAIRMLLENRKV